MTRDKMPAQSASRKAIDRTADDLPRHILHVLLRLFAFEHPVTLLEHVFEDEFSNVRRWAMQR
jgi:hypothetical protein